MKKISFVLKKFYSVERTNEIDSILHENIKFLSNQAKL